MPEDMRSDSLVSARYDQFANWYGSWVAGNPPVLGDPELGLLPPELDGEAWLDVACGTGRMARELARRHASVVGVDVSRRMIDGARAEGESDRLEVRYVEGDIAQPSEWWDGVLFDGAVCEMALMDIDDLSATVEAVSTLLRPYATLLVSMVHPCFPGNEAGLSSWPPEQDYFSEGFWISSEHNPVGVRARVGSSHRTLSTYLNTFLDNGFVLERVVEPIAPVPMLLVLSWSRAPAEL